MVEGLGFRVLGDARHTSTNTKLPTNNTKVAFGLVPVLHVVLVVHY